MNTTDAAAKARRTVATIRHWLRRNVIGGTKVGGKWVVDEVSLDARLALDAPTPAPITVEALIRIGGRRWQKAGHDRIYFNEPMSWSTRIDISRYGTGNVSGCTVDDRAVANSRAYGIVTCIDKLWYDVADGKFWARHTNADCYEIRFKDGSRERIDFLADVFGAIKTAARAA